MRNFAEPLPQAARKPYELAATQREATLELQAYMLTLFAEERELGDLPKWSVDFAIASSLAERRRRSWDG